MTHVLASLAAATLVLAACGSDDGLEDNQVPIDVNDDGSENPEGDGFELDDDDEVQTNVETDGNLGFEPGEN